MLKFIKKHLILIIIFQILLIFSTKHLYSKSFKKEPKTILKCSFENMEKELIHSDNDLINMIDHEKLYNTLFKEQNFASEFCILLEDNKLDNIYKINNLIKQDINSKRALINICLSKNDSNPIILNNIISNKDLYFNSENINSNIYKINLDHFGEELLNSDLLSKDIKNNMTEKDLVALRNVKLDPLTFPNNIRTLREYYLSFIQYNLNEALEEDNFNIKDAPNFIKEKYKDVTLKEYNVKISYFDFKYFLLSNINFYKDLVYTYSNNYNLKIDKTKFNNFLRENSEKILEKYKGNGNINISFYINKDEKLSLVQVNRTDILEKNKSASEDILKLSFNGDINSTDNIELNIFDLKGKNLKYNRNLKKEENLNSLTKNISIDNENFLNTKTTFIPNSKKLTYNLKIKEINSEFNKNLFVNFKGELKSRDDDNISLSINSLNYKDNIRDLSIRGKAYISLEKTTINIPTKSIDIFSLSNKEFDELKNRILY